MDLHFPIFPGLDPGFYLWQFSEGLDRCAQGWIWLDVIAAVQNFVIPNHVEDGSVCKARHVTCTLQEFRQSPDSAQPCQPLPVSATKLSIQLPCMLVTGMHRQLVFITWGGSR